MHYFQKKKWKYQLEVVRVSFHWSFAGKMLFWWWMTVFMTCVHNVTVYLAHCRYWQINHLYHFQKLILIPRASYDWCCPFDDMHRISHELSSGNSSIFHVGEILPKAVHLLLYNEECQDARKHVFASYHSLICRHSRMIFK